jgi:hypothetical protein
VLHPNPKNGGQEWVFSVCSTIGSRVQGAAHRKTEQPLPLPGLGIRVPVGHAIDKGLGFRD